jgi:lipopolysaccharide/colanic/teichoic acid biosynthesis glycosyltransferase
MPGSRLSAKAAPLAAVDFLLMIGCYAGATLIAMGDGAVPYLLDENGLGADVFTAAALLCVLAFQGMYSPRRRRVGLEVVLRLFSAMGIVFLLEAVVFYVHHSLALPLAVMLGGSVPVFAALLGRLVYYGVLAGGLGPERLLLVGATPVNCAIAERIAGRPQFGFEVAGFVDNRLERGTDVAGARVLGGAGDLPAIRASLGNHRVISDMGETEIPLSVVTADLISGGFERPDGLYELLFGRVSAQRLRPAALLFAGELAPRRTAQVVQAMYTSLAALAVLAIGMPVFLAITLIVKLSSSGPVFDAVPVMGWQFRTFSLLRFRCHAVQRAESAEMRELTRVGAWIRRLRLEDLPALLNVLRGELALVGPAPVRIEVARALIEALPYYRLRFSVKPGLAGWSQINASFPSAIEQLEYDLYYIKYMSLALDFSILHYALVPERSGAGAAAAVE